MIRSIAPEVPLRDVMLGSLPFVVIMLLFIVLLALVPEIATWLPNHVMGPGR